MNNLNRKYSLLKEKINELNDIIDDIILYTDDLYMNSKDNNKIKYNLDLQLILDFKKNINEAYYTLIKFKE